MKTVKLSIVRLPIKGLSLLVMMIGLFCFSACQENAVAPEVAEDDALVQKLLAMGFDLNSIEDQGDAYLVDGKVTYPKSELSKLADQSNDAGTTTESTLASFYRYFNPRIVDHFYTADPSEFRFGNLTGYRFEGIIGRIYRSSHPGTVPLFRYFNRSGDHFYTTNFQELGYGRAGYNYQGIKGYVFPGGGSGRLPLYRFFNSTLGNHFYTTNYNEGRSAPGYRYEGVQCYIAR